ncbi:MAG: radical SAM protein, partial [Candidatus Electrothrix sp. AUS4]|nr:radical SAM protein [Candidatus Electrothrix sp. AUS4]
MELSPEKMLAANQAEYSNDYSRMPFISPVQAKELISRREQLLAQLAESSTCSGTKFTTGPLSPGCRTCGQGIWSCLFINGICNGRCFYCPTSQKSKGEPSTNALRFANPKDYLDYIAQFDFKGVSLSGGEPLLTFDRTMNYVKKLKHRFGTTIHLWMYTNGILATEDKIAELAEAGLDEIRFDISADDYTLEKLRLAVRRIPCVTVEIPAIPEDYIRLRDLLPKLV